MSSRKSQPQSLNRTFKPWATQRRRTPSPPGATRSPSPSRSAEAQNLDREIRSFIFDFVHEDERGVVSSEIVELLKNKEILTELGRHNRSFLYDMVNLSFQHNYTLENRSIITHTLLSTLFQNGDADIIAELMMTRDDKQDLPSLDLFKLEAACWEIYFQFIAKNIASEEKRKAVALLQFTNKNTQNQSLFTIMLLEKNIEGVARYFAGLKYALDQKLINVENLNTILGADIVTAATSEDMLMHCLHEFMFLNENYSWNPDDALMARNDKGFDFIQALIVNIRKDNNLWQGLENVLKYLQDNVSDTVIKSLILNRSSDNYTILHQAANTQGALPVVLAFLTENMGLLDNAELRSLITQKTQNGFTCLHHLALNAKRISEIVKLKNFIDGNFEKEEAKAVWEELLTAKTVNGYLPGNPRNKAVCEFLNSERASIQSISSCSSVTTPGIARTLSKEGLFPEAPLVLPAETPIIDSPKNLF